MTSIHSPMHPQLESVLREFETASARVQRLAGGHSEAEWVKPGESGGWSAADCIVHLNLTALAYLPVLDGALARAREMGGGVPERLRRDPVGWLLWKMVGPGGRVKTKTGPAFVPKDLPERDELVREFTRLQDEQVARVRQAEGLPIHRVKVASPFDPRASYSLYSALTILPAHQHRHLAQAERAIRG